MKEICFGIIPIREVNQEKKVLLVQHRAGHWGFPKGHALPGEKDQEAAIRELFEETGLIIQAFLNTPPIVEEYSFIKNQKKISKQVIYYQAYVKGTLKIDENEIITANWFFLKEAQERATFTECKMMIRELLNG